jgi:hypothetical protein
VRARRALPLLLLSGAVVLFFHRLALTNRILARGDVYLYFYPYWEAAASALRSGRFPLWNPDLFMGAPLLANSQVGFFYPPNWPLWLLLPVPYAASATIVLHLLLAAAGTYLLGRRALGLPEDAAMLAALLFALGGYLSAQVEHLNQLQGLAWLPWALLAMGRPAVWRAKGAFLRRFAALSLLLSLQLLAGHAQTVLITGVAVFLWWLAAAISERPWRASLPSLAGLVLAAAMAAALSAVQLIPTLELARLSSRQGGLPLNEALSFSLHPLLLGRALLPGYGQALFTEYVAYLPLTALLLVLAGAWGWRRRPEVWPLLLLVAAGLLLALGRFNPIAIGLALLPGFNLFRAPARWLALYALGAALLAGSGWQQWRDREAPLARPLRWGLASIALLFIWTIVAPLLARVVPTTAEAPVTLPAWLTAGGWALELLLASVLLRRATPLRRWARPALLALALLALYFGGRALPYHRLATAPQAYFSLRPPVARLQALNACADKSGCDQPPGRVLSLSNIFFDLGDMAELQTAYGDYLSEAAFAQLLVAHKHKEVLDPNLPLAYGLPSVDGFDGGILPLQAYSELTALILPEGETTTDGRLREFLPAVPAAHWLDLFQAQYLITDKTADVWREGVFFDRQHLLVLGSGEAEPVGYLPPYEATAVWLLADGPGQVEAGAPGGSWQMTTEEVAEGLWQAQFPEPAILESLALRAGPAPWRVDGIALVDSRDGSFQPLVPGAYRLVHSGDVKIYENLDVLPRAFVVHRWQWQPDVSMSIAVMSGPSFEPREEAVLVGSGEAVDGQGGPGRASITHYAPEEVRVAVETVAPGLLLLADAVYPGWSATVGGGPAPIYQADGLFRGVMVPAGSHDVVFRYEPASVRVGAGVTIASLLVWLVLLFTARRAGRASPGDSRKL